MSPWDAADLEFDASTFSGVVRLFPLPNLVLYPHVMQPLHIFEGRYREMLEDALGDDGLIAMALLEPGWEPEYEGRPPIASHACLGRIVAHRRLEDGRYNVLLLGVARIRVVHELPPLRSFRQAEVEVLNDCCDLESGPEHYDLQQELMSVVQRFMPGTCQASDQLGEMLTQHLPLGLLTDLAAYSLPLDIVVKQQLLAECRIGVRARRLLEEISAIGEVSLATSARDYPPRFSVN
jgi:Lon protease-like protein